MGFLGKFKVEIFLILILIAGYFILRLPNLTLQPIFADEAIYIRWAQVMRAEPTLRFVSVSDGKTPLFMWAMIPFLKIFSDPLFAGRFLSVISGMFTLIGVYFLARKIFGKSTAFWASLLYVITPYTVFFDRIGLVDSMLAGFTIWIIYFALWLAKSPRLDLAMILGYLMGGAILTKTPGIVNLLILPISAIAFARNKFKKHGLVRLVLLMIVAIGIAEVMYNMLRLGPQFQMLSSRNADYVFSPLELIGRPLDPFLPHFGDIKDWFPKLLTWPVLGFLAAGCWFLVKTKNKMGYVLFLWGLIPLLIEMAFLKTFTARYLLSSIPPLLIFSGFGINEILHRVKISSLYKVFLGLIIVLPLALNFDYQLLFSPPPKDLPKEERKGYFEDWTAGYGFKEIASFLVEQNEKQKVVVGTEGSFGTLPDGLQIYLDKSGIAIVASQATISAQVRNAAKDYVTFFVGNKNNINGKTRDVKLIKEFVKAKPLDGSPGDSTVLYQVFP